LEKQTFYIVRHSQCFVDFDGKQALDLAKNLSHLSEEFLKKACPNIVNGINELKDWISNNSS